MFKSVQKVGKSYDKKNVIYYNNFKRKYSVELFIVIFWIIIYGLTTSHTVVEGDTGEFLASAAVHGVPHDPGFPLYSIVTRIMYLLPFAHTAWSINFISAIFATFTLVFLYRIVLLITKNIYAAIVSVLTLGTYVYFWFYASVAQIHSLQVLLLALFSYFLVLLVKTKSIKYFYYCSFIVSLGIANNYTIVFVLPSLMILLYYFKKNISYKIVLHALLFFISGLLLYLYTIWAASTSPLLNWGRIHDVNSFFYMFLRGDYGLFSLGPQAIPYPSIYYSFFYYFQNLFITSWYILPFAVISLWLLYKKNLIYILLFCSYLFLGPFFYLVLNQPIISVTEKANVDQYFSYSYLYISIFSGLGVDLILGRFKNFRLQKFILFTICVIFFLIPFLNTYNDIKLETGDFVANSIKFMFSEVPKNSIIVTSGDDFYFPSLYWQYFKGYRNDVTVINFTLSANWYLENLHIQHPELKFLTNPQKFYSYLCSNIAAKGKLFIYPWNAGFEPIFGNKCEIIPYGLLEKVTPKKMVPRPEILKSFNDAEWQSYSHQVSPGNYNNTSSRTREFLLALADQLTYTGFYYQQIGKNNWAFDEFKLANGVSPDEVSSLISESTIEYKRNDIATAMALLVEGINRNPSVDILYKNLGVYYLKENNRSEAYQNFQHYLNFNPQDSNLPAIQNFVASYQLNGE